MAKSKKIKCPTQEELFEPVFDALIALGGSATIEEIRNQVIAALNLSNEAVDEPHAGDASQRTELEYQLAWARSKLKAYGAIQNCSRGVWVITPEFSDKKVSRAEIIAFAKAGSSKSTKKPEQSSNGDNNTEEKIPEELAPWRNELAEIVHNMNPYAFERLSMLLLRNCGFTEVTVTKKSGDGGIDGVGKFSINGIFSISVAFQCKRFKGSVTVNDIRDFRGSLTAGIEKGIFITTGNYTKAARDEAANMGKNLIDLIDGEKFIDKLIECEMGVRKKVAYEVDRHFFDKI